MEQISLKRGDVVRRSIAGARGFYYPDLRGRAIMVREDCLVERQIGWNECSNLMPVSAPSNVFAEKDRYDSSASKMVVWVSTNG